MHRIKQYQTEYLMATHQEQINSGLTTEQVKFTTSLPVLRNASIDGIVKVYEFMTGPFGRELVQKVSDLFYLILYSNAQFTVLGTLSSEGLESVSYVSHKQGCSDST